MNLRDWLAGQAMQAIISKAPFEESSLDDMEAEYKTARGAYDYADAMLAERSKRQADTNIDLREALDACISELDAWIKHSGEQGEASQCVIDRAKRALINCPAINS